jgi:predicted phage terminase large subunit-like protein
MFFQGGREMGRIFRRKRGDVLQPERFTSNEIRSLRSRPREFDGQYQQEPIPQSGVIFNPNWWKYFKSAEMPEFDLVVISVDCAFKAKTQNDFVSIQKWGMVGARSYLIDCRTEHLGFAATKAGIKAMQQHGRPASTILIEDKANGSAVIEELKGDPDFGAAVIAIEPSGGKESRAHAASTDCEAGSVYLAEDGEWLASFLRTAAAFPAVKHDDDIDAMTQFLNWRRTRSLSLTLVDYYKSLASGTRKLYDRAQKAFQSEERMLRRTGQIKGSVNQAVNTNETDLPANCPHCGGVQLERVGSSGKCRCTGCGKYSDSPLVKYPCPKCGSNLTGMIEGDEWKCKQCGFQFRLDRTDERQGESLGCLPGCPTFLRQIVAGRVRCGNCGAYHTAALISIGMSRKNYAARTGFGRSYGRFGGRM